MPTSLSSGITSATRRLSGAKPIVRATILAVFLASIAIRAVLLASVTPVLVSDARDYHVLAKNLAEGRGYMCAYQGETAAFNGFTFRAFRSPGYPVFLAGLSLAFGWSPYVPLIANIVADLVTQACCLLIAAHLFNVGPAVFVQLLLGLHVLWTPNPMTESLHTALFSLLALLLVFGWPLKSWGAALAFGLLAAAALFVRPITICVFPALLWKLTWQTRSMRSVLCLMLTVLPSAAGVAAWATRNYRLFGEFVPFATNVGHHNAFEFGLDGDLEFARLRAAGLNEAQINAALVRMERDKASAHPLRWLVTCVQRAAGLFSLEPAWEVQHVLWELMFPTQPNGSLVSRLYRAAYNQYYITYALAAGGALLLAVRRRGLAGLWALMLFYVAIHAAVSRGDIRLAAPLYPLMCLLAGALVAEVFAHPQGSQAPGCRPKDNAAIGGAAGQG